MNIHSILETLKGSAVLEAEGKLELTEDSFLSEVVIKDNANDGDLNAFTTKVNWRDCKQRAFPVAWLLLTAVWFLLKCIIYAIYWLAERIRCLFTNEKPRIVLGTSPRVNLILMLSVVTVYFMMLVSMLMFFVKDVVLFRPDTYVNDSGAICFPQSSKREHYVFLINTAKCWSNTGIKVLKGDKVTVSASGSFFSKIGEMDSFARSNIMSEFSRVNVFRKSQDKYYTHEYLKDDVGFVTSFRKIAERDSIAKSIMIKYSPYKSPFIINTQELWMYHKEGARFGSLLVQIKYDYEVPSCDSGDGEIIQLDTIKCCRQPCFVADTDGVLNFAVNDIYLNERNKSNITELIDELHLGSSSVQKVLNNCKKRPQMWYDDNVGDILLSIRIDRKDMNISKLVLPPMAKAYFFIDDFFFTPCLCHRMFCLTLCLLLWFIIDFAIARGIIRQFSKHKRIGICK